MREEGAFAVIHCITFVVVWISVVLTSRSDDRTANQSALILDVEVNLSMSSPDQFDIHHSILIRKPKASHNPVGEKRIVTLIRLKRR